MSEKMVIHKNKGETFQCHFKVEGAEIKDTIVRLCLEFEDNQNMFFYGKLEKDGACVVDIPKLKNVENTSGKLVVEVIADSIYFKVFESEVELKNSVEVKVTEAGFVAQEKTKIKLESIASQPKSFTINIKEPIQEETKEPVVELKEAVQESVADKPAEKPKRKAKFSKFTQYMENKN
jgi:hypothetical protein